MTPTEIDHAAMWRMPLIAPNLLTPLTKPMKIEGLTKKYRSEEEAARRGGEKFYYEVQLRDPNGRSIINCSPAQLEPYDREQFDAMMARWKAIRNMKGSDAVGD